MRLLLIMFFAFLVSASAQAFFGGLAPTHPTDFKNSIHLASTNSLQDEFMCSAGFEYDDSGLNRFNREYRATIYCISGNKYIDSTSIKNKYVSGTNKNKAQAAHELAVKLLNKSGFKLFAKDQSDNYYYNPKYKNYEIEKVVIANIKTLKHQRAQNLSTPRSASAFITTYEGTFYSIGQVKKINPFEFNINEQNVLLKNIYKKLTASDYHSSFEGNEFLILLND